MKRQSEKGLPRYLGGGGGSPAPVAAIGGAASPNTSGGVTGKGSPVRQPYGEVRTRTKSYGE
jgi:hypothetical protein